MCVSYIYLLSFSLKKLCGDCFWFYYPPPPSQHERIYSIPHSTNQTSSSSNAKQTNQEWVVDIFDQTLPITTHHEEKKSPRRGKEGNTPGEQEPLIDPVISPGPPKRPLRKQVHPLSPMGNQVETSRDLGSPGNHSGNRHELGEPGTNFALPQGEDDFILLLPESF